MSAVKSIFGGGDDSSKALIAQQQAQLDAQKKEAETQLEARKKAMLNKASGRASLLSGSELGTEQLKTTLG